MIEEDILNEELDDEDDFLNQFEDLRDGMDDDSPEEDDDIFGQCRMQSIDDTCSSITVDLNRILTECEHSPMKYPKNNITGISNPESHKVYLHYGLDDGSDTVFCPVTALRDIGYTCYGFTSENEEITASRLLLYGHHLDTENKFGSRLDTYITDELLGKFDRKFNEVSLHGAFASIEDMKRLIDTLYDNCVDKVYGGFISVYLDSKVKDDDGNLRTLASLLSSGYIPGLTDRGSSIRYIYRRFPKHISARIFSDRLSNDLFEDLKKIEDDTETCLKI